MSDERGQMAVELAVLMPVILAAILIVWNLGRFLTACVLFDRTARDLALAQGVSVSGEQTDDVRVEEIAEALGEVFADWPECEVAVAASRSSSGGFGPLVQFRCTLSFRPWPSSFVVAGVNAGIPFALVHEAEISCAVFQAGVAA